MDFEHYEEKSQGDEETPSSSQPRYVGAIDIGTNSIHLLLASVDPVLHTFNIELAEKSTTRLGERESDSGALTAIAIKRSLETLRRFKELALSHNVEQLMTAATSAVREAPNGGDFLIQIKDDLGIEVDLISGAEEARLIYLGVLSGMSFGGKPHILVDIGGGSTELILADGRDARALTSTRIGAVRLQRDFIKSEPISNSRREFLKTFIQGSFEPAVEKILSRIQSGQNSLMVGTSGTAMAIGNLLSAEEENSPLKLHGYRIAKKKLDSLLEKLVQLTPSERCLLPSLSERRAEIIVPGALILQTIMEMFNIDEITLSERALREGLIVDWMLRKRLLEDRFNFQSSIRQRTVIHQAQRFAVNQEHAEKVANHALSFYDQTYGLLHNDSGEGRELLWAAAMLHSCGKHIHSTAYHKHSWYLIRHGELLGYSHLEHLMVAAIARYHRRSLPKKRHYEWQSLITKQNKKLVEEMALILRLASALNRRPKPVVSDLKISLEQNNLIIYLKSERKNNKLELEEWSLMNCSGIIKEITGRNLKVFTGS